MAKPNEPDLSPKSQRDQPHKGPITKPQVTDATMGEKDLAQGSEPETRGASRRR